MTKYDVHWKEGGTEYHGKRHNRGLHLAQQSGKPPTEVGRMSWRYPGENGKKEACQGRENSINKGLERRP